MSTFIERIASELLENHQPMHQTLVLLPNQRAELFLREALKPHLEQPTLLPLFSTVDGFISNAAQLTVLEPLVLLLELHQAHNEARYEASPEKEPEPLGAFLSWGQTLLSDFGEIDRYLLNPSHVLGDLYNIQKLEEWDLSVEQQTQLMLRYSDFVSQLPATYRLFKERLLDRGEAHSGLAARTLAEHPELVVDYLKRNGISRVVVAGLNALNTAELTILETLRTAAQTRVLWDLDPHYFDNNEHEAGLFMRGHVSRQKVFGKDAPSTKGLISEWRDVPKDIRPVGASQFAGQAKAVAHTLQQWHDQGVSPQHIAVVLADETLLTPVLSVLPEVYEKVNITMGFPLAQSAVAATVRLWIGAVEYAIKNARNEHSRTYYYRSLSALFSDPLFNRYWESQSGDGPADWNRSIVKGNRVFTSSDSWREALQQGPSGYHHLLAPASGKALLEPIKAWLKHVGSEEQADTMIINTAYKIHTLLEQLDRSLSSQEPDSLALLKLIKQQLKQGTIDFVGEPLEGLQIMGILESRTLDFSHIIIAGVNEGVLPAGRSFNSFLPYDLKRHYGLPTYEQKDAVYAYHFYRILQRCTEAVITYSTDKDSLKGGEPSRYITQLEFELRNTAAVVHPRSHFGGPLQPSSLQERFTAPRTPAVKEALKEWMERGISASSLNALLEYPDQFYKQKLALVREEDEVEDSMSHKVLGNLLHNGLEALYEPFNGKTLPEIDVEEWTEKGLQAGIDSLIQSGYSKSSLYHGRNLLTLEICKTMFRQFLTYDRNRAKKGGIILHNVEQALEVQLTHPTLNIPLTFRGKVDRIETCQGTFTIWDYKTGALADKDLALSNWSGLWSGSKGKSLQVLLYAWMYYRSPLHNPPFPWRAGMYKLQSSDPEIVLKSKKGPVPNGDITEPILLEFESELMNQLAEILASDEPFMEPAKNNY